MTQRSSEASYAVSWEKVGAHYRSTSVANWVRTSGERAAENPLLAALRGSKDTVGQVIALSLT
jgi:hypothetical protein